MLKKFIKNYNYNNENSFLIFIVSTKSLLHAIKNKVNIFHHI